MSSLLRIAVAGILFGALAPAATDARAAAPVPPDAGKAITFPYPVKAPIVVQLNGIGTARERLNAMLKAALPNEAAQLDKQIDEGLKHLLGNRKLTGIPKDGRVFLVVHDIQALFEETPAVSVLVPVMGYKDFRDSFLTADERKTFVSNKGGVDEVKMTLLGEELPVYLVDLKEYVAISPDKGTAETYTKKYTKATTAAMGDELAKSFVSADVAVYVNMDVINDLYGDQIRQFKGLIDLAFMQPMGAAIPGLGKKQLEAAKRMLQGAFQGAEDCRGIVVSVEFRREGLNIRAQAQFAEDTPSVKLLKGEAPAKAAGIEKLPAGLNQYTAVELGKTLRETLRGLTGEFAPADDDEKSNEAIDKLQKELLAAGPHGEVAGSAAPGVALTVTAYKEPEKAAAALVGCYAAMSPGGRVQTAVLKDAPKVTKSARKHRGFTFSEVGLSFDFEATVKDLPEPLKENTLAQLKRTVSEKMTVWIGTDGKTIVQASGKDWASAAAALDQYLDSKKTIGETAGYKLTRKNLPPEVSYLLLMETGQTITTLLDALRTLEEAIPDFPKIGKPKPIKGEPTYIGVALTLKGDTATFNLFVPGPAIAAGYGLLNELFKKIE